MSKQNSKINREGFTIIEVVLVLAIAGLIFLMVFIALPALQRSQRDTARRNDMSRVDTSLTQYQTNHSTDANNLPNNTQDVIKWTGTTSFDNTNDCNAACKFVRDYMNTGASETNKKNEFNDPDGEPYNVVITPNWAKYNTAVSTSVSYNDNSKLINGEAANSFTIGGNSPFSEHVVYIIPGGRCSGSDVVKSERRHFAILYRLEGAGVYCIDDQ